MAVAEWVEQQSESIHVTVNRKKSEHKVCIIHTQCMHNVCAMSLICMHKACTIYAWCMHIVCITNAASSAHKMHTKCTPSTGNTKSAISSGDPAEGASVSRAALGRHPLPVLVHGEAALHAALGEQPENRVPAPHHLHERHRELGEAVKTKAKKTNNQASFGGGILKANMEVEAVIQLAHDLDETCMPCVCIGVRLLGVLLDLPERV